VLKVGVDGGGDYRGPPLRMGSHSMNLFSKRSLDSMRYDPLERVAATRYSSWLPSGQSFLGVGPKEAHDG
jgi:hypothetical protein